MTSNSDSSAYFVPGTDRKREASNHTNDNLSVPVANQSRTVRKWGCSDPPHPVGPGIRRRKNHNKQQLAPHRNARADVVRPLADQRTAQDTRSQPLKTRGACVRATRAQASSAHRNSGNPYSTACLRRVSGPSLRLVWSLESSPVNRSSRGAGNPHRRSAICNQNNSP